MNVLNIETQSKIALLGGAFRWQDTKILETSASLATDPFRHAGLLPDGWWRRSEPRYADGREVILIRMGDNKEEENKFVRQSDEPAAASDDELAPNENENISEWLGRVATRGGTDSPFWKMMHSYAGRFRGDAPARKTLDRKLVSSFLKNLRGTARSK